MPSERRAIVAIAVVSVIIIGRNESNEKWKKEKKKLKMAQSFRLFEWIVLRETDANKNPMEMLNDENKINI